MAKNPVASKSYANTTVIDEGMICACFGYPLLWRLGYISTTAGLALEPALTQITLDKDWNDLQSKNYSSKQAYDQTACI